MVNLESKRLGDLLLLANGVALALLITTISNHFFFRLDLTEEKRFSIKEPTKEMLQTLEDPIYVEVFLEGDLNSGFRRFQKSIQETLEEFRVYSNNRVRYSFVDPSSANSKKAQQEFIQELGRKGIIPTNVVDQKDGETATKLIFPGALISVGGMEIGVNLLKGNKAATPEEEINQSIEGVEYELANAINKLTTLDQHRIGLTTGHGELDSLEGAALLSALRQSYLVDRVDLSGRASLKQYDALVIARPKTAFTEQQKLMLDQYIMAGGKALFLLDKVAASMDSASAAGYLALPLDVNLDDLLFKYGVRINYDLVQDRSASVYPIITGGQGGSQPKMQLIEWPFFPLINHYPDHPVTRNMDAVLTRFVSSIDTVKAVGISKTPLLLTSQSSRLIGTPADISIEHLLQSDKVYESGPMAVAYLLEGSFTSLYKNRFLPEGTQVAELMTEGPPTKIVVVADGDVGRNDVNPRSGQPQALGFDPFSQYTFANEDFIMNTLSYLTNDRGLIQARSKEIKIRPLDEEKIRTERGLYQSVNIGLPIGLLILFGVVRFYWRKRKYTRF